MTWFLTEQEATTLLATVVQHPGYTYAVRANGCGPGWGIMVHDPDGTLMTESYSPGDIIPLREPHPSRLQQILHELTTSEYRELLIKAEALGAHTHDDRSS